MLEGALKQEERNRDTALALQQTTQGLYEEQRSKADGLEVRFLAVQWGVCLLVAIVGRGMVSGAARRRAVGRWEGV